VALGLFFIGASACGRPRPHELARADDRVDRTELYTWLVEHEPSKLVAWRVPVERLRSLLPDARVEAGREPNPCAQAAALHAALVVVAREGAGRERALALDCGIALYHDAGGLVIAPR
jgi:hypothetical protein